jgi:hypothetical protein
MSRSSNPFAYLVPGSLPDWRNVEAYPDPGVASLETWAAAFMARNPDFQRDAKALLAHVGAMASVAPTAPPQGSSDGTRLPVHDQWVVLNAGMAELVQKYGAKQLPYHEVLRIPVRTYADLFGHAYDLINRLYAELASMRGEAPPAAHPFNPLSAPPGNDPDREYWILPKEHAQLAIRFNLEYPLKPQFAAAEKLLKEERDRLAKQKQIAPVTNRRRLKRAELYRTYLRLLDADASAAPVREMAQVLFPRRGNEYPEYRADHAVRDQLEAAKKLRDGGYRNLPLLQK